MSRAASLPRAALAQAAAELRLTARRGENLLAMLGIPIVVLLFFASSPLLVLPDRRPVDVLVPGSIALAIIASGLVNLGIATAFERSYGVLKRLGGSPLGRPGLVVAKMTAVATIVVAQVVLLLAIASMALGWEPGAALLILAVWAVAAASLTVRTFRWD